MDAVRHPPVPARGTELQARRALLQASELIMVNVADLMHRAQTAVAGRDARKAVRLLEWLAATTKLWAIVAERGPELWFESDETDRASLTARQSPNWEEFELAERGLAREIAGWLFSDSVESPGDGEAYAAAKRALLRITMSERLVLENLPVPWPHETNYGRMVRSAEIRSCVHSSSVPNTVFMEFRTTHQVPEILTDAINDHIERALSLINDSAPLDALAVLRRTEVLLDCSTRSLELLTENLRQDEYHAIREYLGLTSGSHSVGLAYHLMRDLYPMLAECLSRQRPKKIARQEWWLLRASARSIGVRIDRWRLEHLNLPRGSLGEAAIGTRSLIGARDALQTVSKLRESSRRRDPLLQSPARFYTSDWQSGDYSLEDIESRILAEMADVTQSRFGDIQTRSGRFEKHPAFQAPPVRFPILDDPGE